VRKNITSIEEEIERSTQLINQVDETLWKLRRKRNNQEKSCASISLIMRKHKTTYERAKEIKNNQL